MDLTLSERDRRWSALGAVLRRRNVDVLIAFSDFGDQNSIARYITNFRSTYDHVAALLYADETCEQIFTHPGGIPLAQQLSWATDVFPMAAAKVTPGHNSSYASGAKPSLGGQIANRLSERGVRTIGVAGMEFFPTGWKELIEAAIPDADFVDIWDDVHPLRLVKSDVEQNIIREACRISDEAWSHMPDIVRVGRRQYEVLADIEQILRANGCEDSFNLCMSLPMLAEPPDRIHGSARLIEADRVYMVEVSPRYLGYYGQQTGLVATGAIPAEMQAAYDAVNRARDAGLKMVRPGADLARIGDEVARQLRTDGFEPASPSFGHAVGLELEDWHIDGSSLVLEAGMTLILHPMAAGHPAVMRADTFLVTDSGFERLTTGSTAPLTI